MAPRADRAQYTGGRRTAPGWFTWWISPSTSLAWRLPLLVAVALLCGWYVFRGLVRMAFIFDASAIVSFLLAPLLLPLAALPAVFLWLLLRFLPALWRDSGATDGRKALTTAALVPAVAMLASFIDRIESIGLLSMGLRLPRFLLEMF